MPKRSEKDILLFSPEEALSLPDRTMEFFPSLTEEERRFFPNVQSLDSLLLTARILGQPPVYEAKLSLSGKAVLRDAHDGSSIPLDIDEEVDVVLDESEPENSDLLPEKDGRYDLRGTFLGLLHDALPASYSCVPLGYVETEDYVLMDEDEYEKRRRKTNIHIVGEEVDD